MRAKAAEDLADEGDVAGAAIVQARNKFLTQVNCSHCAAGLGVISIWTKLSRTIHNYF